MFDIHEAARGRWRGILSHQGLSQRELSGKHCPCPMCGGTDRFRFDDKGGRGTFICTNCGAGSGIDLVMKLKGMEFKEAVEEVKGLVGIAKAEPIKAGMTDEQKRDLRLSIWNSSVPISKGDHVDTYLSGRGVGMAGYAKVLRLCPDCRYAHGKSFPAMIAAVQDPSGVAVSLHRTFIHAGEKAPVDNPRMVTPGELPSGSAVRLRDHGEVLGVAEGIETALAAAILSDLPVWATLNANLMAEWEPPGGVREVVVFADNDASFTGQSAAYRLAHRLTRNGLSVTVRIPPQTDTDWVDVLRENETRQAA